MAKTQFNVEQFKTEAKKPLFAVAGATELAVEFARGYATEAQKATQERLTEVQTRVSDVQARVAKVDLEPYLTTTSDIVALMVLEYQTHVHNLITRANHETRSALVQNDDIARALGYVVVEEGLVTKIQLAADTPKDPTPPCRRYPVRNQGQN